MNKRINSTGSPVRNLLFKLWFPTEMNELRKYTRYPLEQGDVAVTLDLNGTQGLKGKATDLSTGGFSFIVEGLAREPELNRFMFVRIDLGAVYINAEVEKRWSSFKRENGVNFYTAGVSFNVISGEDRLKLNDIIENIRSGSLSRE